MKHLVTDLDESFIRNNSPVQLMSLENAEGAFENIFHMFITISISERGKKIIIAPWVPKYCSRCGIKFSVFLFCVLFTDIFLRFRSQSSNWIVLVLLYYNYFFVSTYNSVLPNVNQVNRLKLLQFHLPLQFIFVGGKQIVKRFSSIYFACCGPN